MNPCSGGGSMNSKRATKDINAFFYLFFSVNFALLISLSLLRTSKNFDIPTKSISLILVTISTLMVSIIFSFNWSFFDFEKYLFGNEKYSIPIYMLSFLISTLLMRETWIFTRDNQGEIFDLLLYQGLVFTQFFVTIILGGMFLSLVLRRFISENEEKTLVNAEKNELISKDELVMVLSIGSSNKNNISTEDILRIFRETLDRSITDLMKTPNFSKPPYNFDNYAELVFTENLRLLVIKLGIEEKHTASLTKIYKEFCGSRNLSREVLTVTIDKLCDEVQNLLQIDRCTDLRIVYHLLSLLDIIGSRTKNMSQAGLREIRRESSDSYGGFLEESFESLNYKKNSSPADDLVLLTSIIFAAYSEFAHKLSFISPSDHVYEELLNFVFHNVSEILESEKIKWQKASENYVVQKFNSIGRKDVRKSNYHDKSGDLVLKQNGYDYLDERIQEFERYIETSFHYVYGDVNDSTVISPLSDDPSRSDDNISMKSSTITEIIKNWK